MAVTAVILVMIFAYPCILHAAIAPWSRQSFAALLNEDNVLDRVKIPTEDETFSTDHLGLGTVSAVDTDSKDQLYILHRADRPWTQQTFHGNVLVPSERVLISKDTIVKVTADSAEYISSFGADIFYVPHGLTVDDNDNVWITDVGSHQVFRFPKNSTIPDLVLGEKFVPGNDQTHFCQPSGVAVATNGDFFVADGYCNSRIVKFSKDGHFLAEWGYTQTSAELTPYTLNLVHSVMLIERMDLLCVADRQNQRSLCYNAGIVNTKQTGVFDRTLIPQGEMGFVFALDYNKADDTVIAASETSGVPFEVNGMVIYPARAYTYSLGGQQTQEWAFMTPKSARRGPSLIHDLCSSSDGRRYYLADLPQKRVLRYNN